MTEKGTPSETPITFDTVNRLICDIISDRYGEPLVSALHLCLDLAEQNSRLRDELAETERKYLDAWRESQVERAAAVAAEAALAEEKRLHTLDCEAHGEYVAAAESELEKKTAALERILELSESPKPSGAVAVIHIANAALQPEDKHES